MLPVCMSGGGVRMSLARLRGGVVVLRLMLLSAGTRRMVFTVVGGGGIGRLLRVFGLLLRRE